MPNFWTVLATTRFLLWALGGCGEAAWAGAPVPESDPRAQRIAAAGDPVLPAASEALLAADSSAVINFDGNPLLATADNAGPPIVVAAPPNTPSQNVTINLIRRMVKKGLLDQDEADELIHQAEADTAIAKAQAAAAAMEVVQQMQAEEPPMPDDAVRVTYIPESVKAQIRDQVKSEVMATAKNENWAAPHSVPNWALKMRVGGDVRIRGEGIYYPGGNDNGGSFPNFNAINTGGPFDVSGTVFSPQLDVDRDRQRLRLRVRLGAEIDMGDGFTAGVRLATGNDNSPITANQTFGQAGSGQGGNFSKYAVWLDRGYLKYELGGRPNKSLALTAGRFDNPFFKASEIMWDDDVGFDGVAAHAHYEVLRGFVPFITGGAFPIFNTDLNFATNNPSKFRSYDKWLYAIQGGFDWKVAKQVKFKFGASYNLFDNIEGRLSKPFVPLTASDAGDTDASRPSYAQNGNTYRPLRDIIPTVDNDFGTSKQFQYFGLATPFRVLNLSGQLDLNYFEPVQISLFGEYARNLAFNGDTVNSFAVNNRGAINAAGLSKFEGGDTAWYAGIRVGKAVLEKRWDWNVGINYRYVESDAVVDGFVDSDFGITGGFGGTNLKGYGVGGNVALSPKVSIGLRWTSANEVAGPPLKSDVVEIDLNGKF